MTVLLLALTLSYVVTWCAGIYTARKPDIDKRKARKIHFSLSLVTCTLLTVYVALYFVNLF